MVEEGEDEHKECGNGEDDCVKRRSSEGKNTATKTLVIFRYASDMRGKVFLLGIFLANQQKKLIGLRGEKIR